MKTLMKIKDIKPKYKLNDLLNVCNGRVKVGRIDVELRVNEEGEIYPTYFYVGSRGRYHESQVSELTEEEHEQIRRDTEEANKILEEHRNGRKI